MHIVILAGGAGTRFWPWSRSARPKQFLPLIGERTLLDRTIDRALASSGESRVWIQTRPDLVADCESARSARSTEERERIRVVAEPEPRDTAPALVLATELVAAEDPTATIAVLPSDQEIGPVDAFSSTLALAARTAECEGGLVTFGIRPSHPATGYGYVELTDESPAEGVHRVAQFREKPDLETAEEYVASGRHRWNSGMFVWTVESFRSAVESSDEKLSASRAQLAEACRSGDSDEIEARFRELPRTSIDYALFEKAPCIWSVDATFDWDDVGSWRALERHHPADPAGNVTLGDGIAVDSMDSTLVSTDGRPVIALGIDGLIVVNTDDCVFVCPRDRAEEVKRVIEALRGTGREELR